MEKEQVKQLLNRYIELDKEIANFESGNVRKKHKELQEQIDQVNLSLKKMEEEYQQKKEKTAKEKADVDLLVEEFTKLGKSDDKKLNREKAEHMEAMSQQQALQQLITTVKDQKDELEAQLKKISGNDTELEKLQQEQDELLVKVFKGNYGSDKENELEQKLDNLLERQQLIQAAHERWKHGKVLIEHAENQLNFSASKWNEIDCVKWEKEDVSKAVTNVRSNLIAASTNLKNAQKYLNNIEFPYCCMKELNTLDRATHNVFSDVILEKQKIHAGEVYTTTYRRCKALGEWFYQVINDRIKVDLQKANKEVRETSRDLRQERIKLMQEIAGDTQEIQVKEYDNFKDDDKDPNVIELVHTDEGDNMEKTNGQNLMELGQKYKWAGTIQGWQKEQKHVPKCKSKLADAPKDQDLFGNVEELKQQFDKQQADSKKTQEFNKARVNQGLEEKLTARRNRRNRNKTD